MNKFLILSIYDGGYEASILYNNTIYDLTRINDHTYDLDYLYKDFIKDNKWYTSKKIVFSFLFNEFDIDIIYVCEDGKITICNRD